MQEFAIVPKEMIACLWRNRGLVKALVQREVVGRYRGSYMGILWSFFNPDVSSACGAVPYSGVCHTYGH